MYLQAMRKKNDSAMNNSGDLLPAYSKKQQQCSSKNCQDHTDIFTVYTATETARGAATTITDNLKLHPPETSLGT